MPSFNKSLLVSLLVLLAAGCSGVRPSGEPAEGTSTGKEQKLPHDYGNALTLMKGGNYKAAIPVLNAFIARKPGLAGPYLNLGIAYRLTGQDDAAVDALNHALKLNPENPSVWHQLAILYRNQGDFDAALDAYRKALELDPNYALAHRNIGILFDLYMQQPALALEHYRKYLSLTGEDDATVSNWVVDLERRAGSAQARTAP